MSDDSYTIIFNSRGSNATVNTANSSVSYNVNWSAILDAKYKRFHCQFVFKSENTPNIYSTNGFVNMNFGTTKIFDGLQMTQNIGIIYPVAFNTNYTFWNSTNNDNNDFYINYPNNNNVTINLNSFSGTAIANMPNYVIILSLKGIDDTPNSVEYSNKLQIHHEPRLDVKQHDTQVRTMHKYTDPTILNPRYTN